MVVLLATPSTGLPWNRSYWRPPQRLTASMPRIPGITLEIDFRSFNVKIICGFTSILVAMYSATSYPFCFPYRRKRPPIEIFKLLVTTLSNQDKKVALIWVEEYEALAIYSELMKTWNNMNIIVQTTGADASSLNGKSKTPSSIAYYLMSYLSTAYQTVFDRAVDTPGNGKDAVNGFNPVQKRY